MSISPPEPGNKDWVEGDPSRPHDPDETDYKLLRKNSVIKSYTTSQFTYPSIRVVYRRHPEADKHSLPLLVMVHGLGGSAAQFHSLLTHLKDTTSFLAIDLPGCGRSTFDPQAWAAYSFESLVDIVDIIASEFRHGDTIVLHGQSMGSAICAQLASRTTPTPSRIRDHVVGYIATCPPAKQLSPTASWILRTLSSLPSWVFDVASLWDAKGGPDSYSVTQWLEPDAGSHIKRVQHRYNMQTRTPVWQRFIYGIVPTFEDDGRTRAGQPGAEIWAGVDVPVLLIFGEADHITPPANLDILREYIRGDSDSSDARRPAFRGFVLPAPANHCLIYLPSTVDVVARRIQDFLEEEILKP
ncbi:unnamed protein product [Clonostachys byssicola]|uniref:AB hydrolase-1 domain-containing protein n=1 Tax=Clonostachys byssicola TaxID=160290 RepID=A0A9N9Y2L7_9HYPO|nr:unnamed protein product [Clonostachys byssicola]